MAIKIQILVGFSLYTVLPAFKIKNMSWKYIFNTTVGNKWWGIQYKAQEMAIESGYGFYSWNGWIYNVDGKKTEILVEDCF